MINGKIEQEEKKRTRKRGEKTKGMEKRMVGNRREWKGGDGWSEVGRRETQRSAGPGKAAGPGGRDSQSLDQCSQREGGVDNPTPFRSVQWQRAKASLAKEQP